MPDSQPNKPDGEVEDGKARRPKDRGAVDNQGTVTPEDYPDREEGKPDYGGN